MRTAVKNLTESINKLEDMFVKEAIDADALRNMDATDLAGVQACLELIEAYEKLLYAEAEQMDRIEDKLNKVLSRLEKIKY